MIKAIAVAMTVFLCAATMSHAQSVTPEDACRQGLAKASTKMAQSLLKAARICENKKAKGKLGGNINCRTYEVSGTIPADLDESFVKKVDKAIGKLLPSILSSCPGAVLPDLPQFLDPAGTTYPNPCFGVTDKTALAECITYDGVGYYSHNIQEILFAASGLRDKDTAKCVNKIAANVEKFAKALHGAGLKCGYGDVRGKPCDDAELESKLSDLETKLALKSSNACSPPSASVLDPMFGGSCSTDMLGDGGAIPFNAAVCVLAAVQSRDNFMTYFDVEMFYDGAALE